jgi:hypothetical protein
MTMMEKNLIKKKSQFDVSITLDRLEASLKDKGINPMARVALESIQKVN